jgi:transposase-like protein
MKTLTPSATEYIKQLIQLNLTPMELIRGWGVPNSTAYSWSKRLRILRKVG